jgi:hypothetical protein
MVLETAQLHPNSQAHGAESLRNLAPYKVNLSGTQLLVGFIRGALCSLGVADLVVLIWGGGRNAKPIAGAGYVRADFGGKPIPKYNGQVHVEGRIVGS